MQLDITHGKNYRITTHFFHFAEKQITDKRKQFLLLILISISLSILILVAFIFFLNSNSFRWLSLQQWGDGIYQKINKKPWDLNSHHFFFFDFPSKLLLQ